LRKKTKERKRKVFRKLKEEKEKKEKDIEESLRRQKNTMQ